MESKREKVNGSRAGKEAHSPTAQELKEKVQAGLKIGNDLVLEILNERLRQRTRRFGAGPAGVFSGFKPIPAITDKPKDGKNIFNNRFFMLSLGVALTYENKLRYAEGAADRDVIWFSVYPAFDQRFKARPRQLVLSGRPGRSLLCGWSIR